MSGREFGSAGAPLLRFFRGLTDAVLGTLVGTQGDKPLVRRSIRRLLNPEIDLATSSRD